jgi:hypothetical protein
VPDAVPAVPPPSNSIVETAVGADAPAVDIPLPTDVPVIELARPDVVPAIEVPETVGGLPKDVCGIEPPTPEHSVVGPIVPNVPDIIGLTPSVLSSVAPSGMPVGATGEPGPMPSGEVAPMLGTALGIAPTCANAGLHAKSAASVLMINVLRIALVPPPIMATQTWI